VKYRRWANKGEAKIHKIATEIQPIQGKKDESSSKKGIFSGEEWCDGENV